MRVKHGHLPDQRHHPLATRFVGGLRQVEDADGQFTDALLETRDPAPRNTFLIPASRRMRFGWTDAGWICQIASYSGDRALAAFVAEGACPIERRRWVAMHDKEITTYLANVLHIASQDGRLTSQELAALGEVRRLVGAKRVHVTEASRLVQDSQFVARGVGTFGAQVRNLEDMVFVGLADADLVPGEREAIELFCEQIGLTQAQLDQIVREAQVRCSDLELRAHPSQDASESPSDAHDAGKGTSLDGVESGHPKQTAIARRACKTAIEDCRAAGIMSVELLPSNRDGEQCAMALSMRGTPLDIDRLPELPLPYCTARRCQCVWIAAG